MRAAKKANLLQLSSQLMAESEMKDVYGSGVKCHPSNCNNDVHTSANNCLDNMKKNNPPIQHPIGTVNP